MNGHCSVVEYLITSGADVNAVDNMSCLSLRVLVASYLIIGIIIYGFKNLC